MKATTKRILRLALFFSIIPILFILRYDVDMTSRGWFIDFLIFAVPIYFVSVIITLVSNLLVARIKSIGLQFLFVIVITIVFVIATSIAAAFLYSGAYHGGIFLILIFISWGIALFVPINLFICYLANKNN